MRKKKPGVGYLYPAKELLRFFPAEAHAAEIAEALNSNRATVQRWRGRNIMLDERRADRYACAMGRHPFEVWPNWFDVYWEQVAS
jgi:hypothetical protein